MRDFVNAGPAWISQTVIWILFFATSLYGHVALKLAVRNTSASYSQTIWAAATSWWGWSTFVAWSISCVLWLLVLSKTKLIIASSVSSLSYVLICLASWFILGERLTTNQWLGAVLITAGIIFLK